MAITVSGKLTRKQPSSGAWLKIGWMDGEQRGQRSQRQTGHRSADDQTYRQCDLHFINEAFDALDNAVSSLTLKTHVDNSLCDQTVVKPSLCLPRLTWMLPSKTPTRKSSRLRSVSIAAGGRKYPSLDRFTMINEGTVTSLMVKSRYKQKLSSVPVKLESNSEHTYHT